MRNTKSLLTALAVLSVASLASCTTPANPSTQAPSTQAPSTQAPSTQAPSTQAPSTQAPSTQAPSTQAPSTQAPSTQAPSTQLPDVNKTGRLAVAQAGSVKNFVAAGYEERIKIEGLLEEYAMKNHITGMVLFEDGGYVKYADRVNLPTATKKDAQGNDLKIANTVQHEYVAGYGFGLLSEGTLSGTLPGVTDAYGSYYRTYESEDPATLNYMNDTGSVVGGYHGYVSGGYFGTKLNSSKDGYVWYPSLATDANVYGEDSRPIPLNLNEFGLATKYKVYVRTGEDAKYALSSKAKPELYNKYNGKPIELADYLTPYKQLHMKANGLERATDPFDTASELVGLQAYYKATESGYSAEAWENVGVKAKHDKNGDYLEFEFKIGCSPFYAMYYLSSSLYAPIPEEFLTDIGGIKVYQSWNTDKTLGPVDTTLSTGPYVVESWVSDVEFTFAKNTVIDPDINGGDHRYLIPGIHVDINAATKQSATEAWDCFKDGKYDGTGIPKQYLTAEKGTDGTQITKGSSTTKMNINTCSQEEWEYLFGENGVITQTPKEKYWEVKPILSNDNFLRGLNHAFDRETYATNRGVTPSVNYFADGYMINPEEGLSVNATDAHKAALEAYYGDTLETYGYDLDVAVEYFAAAAEELLASGAYKEGDKIELEICWQSKVNIDQNHEEFTKYIEDAFNHPLVCDGKLTLDIVSYAPANWKDAYYEKMMVGQFDFGYGGIEGNSLNPINFFEVLKSDNSSNFTLNWGPNTNDSSNGLIEYAGKQFTFDALWQAADTGAVVAADGSNAKLYAAELASLEVKDDGTAVAVIDFGCANIDGVVETALPVVELWFYPDAGGYDYDEIDYEVVDGQIVVNVDAETVTAYQAGTISFDVLFDCQINGLSPVQGLVSLAGTFAAE